MKKAHLFISALGLIPLALSYGSFQNEIIPFLYDFKLETVDSAHIFRAVMGLYFAMIIFWTIGVFKPSYWQAATISNVVFMGGLAIGRLISFAYDGIPDSKYLLMYCSLEIVFTIWGIINLKKYGNDSTSN